MKRNSSWWKWLSYIKFGNNVILVLIGVYFFLVPGFLVIKQVSDPALKNGEIPKYVVHWHKSLTRRYQTWAEERVVSEEAAELSVDQIAATEWPIFGSVYYLWATESLQKAWEADPSLSTEMPSEYAQGAIEAAVELIIDPNHAAWVKDHWGEDYLERENIFYRMLYISGLTSYQSLSRDEYYQDLLRIQVDSLSAELDQSRFGLLDDYPSQCYPIDILPAIAVIQRADVVLGTDHSEMISRAVRGFDDSRLDDQTGLPAYIANSETGLGIGPARGVGISYMLIWAPEIWPETAEDWYQKYESQYWQDSWMVAGVREFAKGSPYPDWYTMDVDAGPVLAGYGTAASAFGIGAARANGQMDQAYQLSSEALLVSWPLLDGTRLGARALSGLSGAPYLGESALLFIFTRIPVASGITAQTSRMPAIVWMGILLFFTMGVSLIYLAYRRVAKWREIQRVLFSSPLPIVQFVLWIGLVGFGIGMVVIKDAYGGLILLALAQFLPRIRRRGRRLGIN